MDQDKNFTQACHTAEEFTKLYYKQMDGNRQLLSKLYLDNGLLVWDGNGFNGADQIQKFLVSLPPTTHVLTTLDAQPVTTGDAENKVLIQATGSVKYSGQQMKQKLFEQTFMLVAVNDKWKIVSDCQRLQPI